MDVFVPEYQDLDDFPKFTARLRQLSQTLAIPEDAVTFLLEVVTFMVTVALIGVTALIMLMAG